MADQTRNGGDSEKVAVRKQPGSDNSPGRGGYSHADTRMGHTHSETLADFEHAVTGSIPPRREDEGSGSDADAMSRGGKTPGEKPRGKSGN